VQVNHRFVRTTTPETFDAFVTDLRSGRRESEVPPHGTLIRVRRSGGLRVSEQELVSERAAAREAREARTPKEDK
jgi:primosomal protein N'